MLKIKSTRFAALQCEKDLAWDMCTCMHSMCHVPGMNRKQVPDPTGGSNSAINIRKMNPNGISPLSLPIIIVPLSCSPHRWALEPHLLCTHTKSGMVTINSALLSLSATYSLLCHGAFIVKKTFIDSIYTISKVIIVSNH